MTYIIDYMKCLLLFFLILTTRAKKHRGFNFGQFLSTITG